MSRSERNTLAGAPTNALVRRVRSILFQYIRSKPRRDDRLWLMTWEWANAVAIRDAMFTRAMRRWPLPSEIASQYVALALLDMRNSRQLALPFNAGRAVPDCVQAHLVACNVPAASSIPLLPIAATSVDAETV